MPWPAYWTHALPELEPLESMKIALSLPGVVGRHKGSGTRCKCPATLNTLFLPAG